MCRPLLNCNYNKNQQPNDTPPPTYAHYQLQKANEKHFAMKTGALVITAKSCGPI